MREGIVVGVEGHFDVELNCTEDDFLSSQYLGGKFRWLGLFSADRRRCNFGTWWHVEFARELPGS